MNVFIFFVLSVLFTEALTELVTKSIIFKYPRKLLSSLGNFPKKMLGCGYCFSVWAAMLPATAAYLTFPSNGIAVSIAQWFVVCLVVHRLSNYIHNINDKLFDKYYSVNHNSQE